MLFFNRFRQIANRRKPKNEILELDLGLGFGETLIYRFDSWHNGLKCTVEDSSGFSERRFDEDLPIKFSHLAYLQQSRDWLATFPDGVSDRIISFQYSYPGPLYPVLLLLAESKHNLELFVDQPALFWATFHNARKTGLDQPQMTEMLSRPRAELLKFCDLPGNKGTLNLLRKLNFERMSAPFWKQFREFAFRAVDHKELNHLNVITEGTLQFVNKYPGLTKARFLTCSDASTKWDDLLETTAEIYRMAEVLEIPVDRQRIIRARGETELTRYHDALSQQIHEQSFTDEVQHFPSPLIPGNEDIQPILDSYELALEGRNMNHCVYSYSQDIIAGNCTVYRVMKPERATLKVSFSAEGIPQLAELKLRSNKPAAKTTFLSIRRWIREALKTEPGADTGSSVGVKS